MKTLISIIALLVSVQAAAFMGPASYEIQEGDSFITPLSGTVSTIYEAPTCDPGMACPAVLPITQLKIDYRLAGCMDSKMSTHKVVYNNHTGEYDVYVSAFNVFNKQSLVTFCIDMPRATDVIFLGPGYVGEESVNVHFLGVEQDMIPFPDPVPGLPSEPIFFPSEAK